MKIRQPRTAAQHDEGKTRLPEASRAPTALIAEDEPPIAAALERELAAAWPELQIVADGLRPRHVTCDSPFTVFVGDERIPA